jgi:polysaccharide deacetylase 2 family uncharacterized protein YibQ
VQHRPRRYRWGRSLIVGVLFAAGFGALIYANSLVLRDAEEPPALPLPPRQNWEADFPSRVEQVTAAVQALPLGLPPPREEPKGSGALRWVHRRYELTVPAPAGAGGTEALVDPIRTVAPGVTVQVVEQATGAQVQIGVDGLLTHTLVLHWLGRRPRAAIIIDDLGNDLLIARGLAAIAEPLTFAVMPFRPFSKVIAEHAALIGREVLLHLPMEAEGEETFGAQDVLLVNADRREILQTLEASLAAVPHVVGVNNHMGSRFTADRERMRWVLARLKDSGLFFVDSRTTAQSVACEVAATLALPCAARTLFLDDTDEEAAIARQLDTLLQLARTRGDVIGIGHARPATLAALQVAVPGFAAAGVDLVPVSTIVMQRSLSGR